MSDRLRRGRWQIHLSTAVLLTLAGGTLLYANMRTHFEFVPPGEAAYSWSTTARPGTNKVDYILRVRGPGWPFFPQAVVAYSEPAQAMAVANIDENFIYEVHGIKGITPAEAAGGAFQKLGRGVALKYTVYNFLIALAVLFAGAVLYELLIRRREGRKA